MEHEQFIAQKLNIKTSQVKSVVDLLEQGATIPFIARYRKEKTGSLDEVAIAAIRDEAERLRALDKRRQVIIESLQEQEVLTPALEKLIVQAGTLPELEDIYLPFKPKRKTRASMARVRGLEPLAKQLWEQKYFPEQLAVDFIVPGEVEDYVQALSGARDIMAEWMSEDQELRHELRELFAGQGKLQSSVKKNKEEQGAKFKDYFEWTEIGAAAAGHRILAMFRGEKEGVLSLKLRPEDERGQNTVCSKFVYSNRPGSEQVQQAAEDSYQRLLAPAMETEIRSQLKEKADQEAIQVFAKNLETLLLEPPLGQKFVMALDPGWRTGAKLVCLDGQGNLLHYETIFPLGSQNQADKAAQTISRLCQRFKIQAVAVGNGTAGRETESFVRGLSLDVQVIMVDESGASIYSASELARQEFPDLDLTVRGAISIGRRLIDPLAELVKLDPKSIGVGQYQHDVDQKALKSSLQDIVERCVNRVGVDVNSASPQLLGYVAGVGPQLAENIVVYRKESGAFTSRTQLKKVKRLGPKAFEQCAGFLRIAGAKNFLDSSGVHPERYSLVQKMAKDLGCSVKDLIVNKELRKRIRLQNYVDDEVGLPTLQDIMLELEKPGRDPRQRFEVFSFAADINEIQDLQQGMQLPGIVTNVTKFGAFVDIGVHQDGLVHISQMADFFVNDPAQVVQVRQKVKVRVLEVDLARKRIALSMREG